MNEQEVVSIMQSSRTEDEWNANADKVKADGGGHYPDFWYGAIVLSGVMFRTSAKFGR
jgi:hypothetical protein